MKVQTDNGNILERMLITAPKYVNAFKLHVAELKIASLEARIKVLEAALERP